MPIREYECPVCGYRLERIEMTIDDNTPECPRAVEHAQDMREMRRLISASSPHFVGSGWTRSSTYDMPRRMVPDDY